jgi:hypothetical protein
MMLDLAFEARSWRKHSHDGSNDETHLGVLLPATAAIVQKCYSFLRNLGRRFDSFVLPGKIIWAPNELDFVTVNADRAVKC